MSWGPGKGKEIWGGRHRPKGNQCGGGWEAKSKSFFPATWAPGPRMICPGCRCPELRGADRGGTRPEFS